MADKLNIYQKLIEVRKAMGKVNKYTDGYGYKYVSGSQVLNKIEDTMNTLGILLEPHLLNGDVREVASVNNKGKNVINYIVASQMKMICSFIGIQSQSRFDRFKCECIVTQSK